MALISCPDCSKEISDKTQSCIHCGCPLDDIKLKMVVLDGIVEEPKGDNFRGVIRIIRELTGFDDIPSYNFYDDVIKSPQIVAKNLTNDDALNIVKRFAEFEAHATIYNIGDTISTVSSYTPSDINAPKCPTCSSKSISKIGVADRVISVALVGLASSKITKQFECKSCGYKW